MSLFSIFYFIFMFVNSLGSIFISNATQLFQFYLFRIHNFFSFNFKCVKIYSSKEMAWKRNCYIWHDKSIAIVTYNNQRNKNYDAIENGRKNLCVQVMTQWTGRIASDPKSSEKLFPKKGKKEKNRKKELNFKMDCHSIKNEFVLRLLKWKKKKIECVTDARVLFASFQIAINLCFFTIFIANKYAENNSYQFCCCCFYFSFHFPEKVLSSEWKRESYSHKSNFERFGIRIFTSSINRC